MFDFRVEGQPIPKARPRVWKGHAHTPQRTKAWADVVGWAARAARVPLHEGDIYVSLMFQRKGKQRADVDNLAKNCMDALNGIAWDDDKQIVALRATVTYGSDNPGVDVIIRRIEDV